ncbi:MAG: hypothetical protein JWR35_905 [Marmoricola sp.]|jgi:hypothetical protein|nr:hypothetical protein [Marmoricola sp.]
MNTVTIDDGRLVVEPQGWDKVWSLRRRLEYPLGHVRGATYDPGAKHSSKGLKIGMRLPGYKWAGTFVRGRELTFWNASAAQGVVEVELAGERYARLYLSVEDPRALVDQINEAVATC